MRESKRGEEAKIARETFYTKRLPGFKSNLEAASDEMLYYELRRIEEIEFSVELARKSEEQMKASGGKDWIDWLEEMVGTERAEVFGELRRRGRPFSWERKRGQGVDPSKHSWEIVTESKSDTPSSEAYKNIRRQWGF